MENAEKGPSAGELVTLLVVAAAGGGVAAAFWNSSHKMWAVVGGLAAVGGGFWLCIAVVKHLAYELTPAASRRAQIVVSGLALGIPALLLLDADAARLAAWERHGYPFPGGLAVLAIVGGIFALSFGAQVERQRRSPWALLFVAAAGLALFAAIFSEGTHRNELKQFDQDIAVALSVSRESALEYADLRAQAVAGYTPRSVVFLLCAGAAYLGLFLGMRPKS